MLISKHNHTPLILVPTFSGSPRGCHWFQTDGSWKYSLNESCWIWTDFSETVGHLYWIPLSVVFHGSKLGEVSGTESRWIILIHSVQYPIGSCYDYKTCGCKFTLTGSCGVRAHQVEECRRPGAPCSRGGGTHTPGSTSWNSAPKMKECQAPLLALVKVDCESQKERKDFRHLIWVTSGEFDHQPPFSPRLSISVK